MQFYSSFSFFCPAGLPQDCPARRVRICRPFRGKGPSTCSKGKTGACVLTRQRRAEPPAIPGPCLAHRRFPPPKLRCTFGKTPPPARRRKTRRPFFIRRRRTTGLVSPAFRSSSTPAAWPTALRSSGGGPVRSGSARRRPGSLPPASASPGSKGQKKRRCRNTVFFCSTRRKTGENIRARSCRTFRRVPAPRNICCARGRTCTLCPPAADSLPCRPSPSSF